MSKIKKITSIFLILAGMSSWAPYMFAAGGGGNYVAMTSLAQTVDNTVSGLATVLIDIAIVTGICFIIAAFFKFHQHKQNPHQVQMSQGVSLLLIGIGFTLIPLLIPTTSVSVLGTAAKRPAQIGGADIHNRIGQS